MGLPWTDWQFWVVTLVALWGAVAILRSVVPRRSGQAPACEKCEPGSDGDSGSDAGPRLVALGRGGGESRGDR